MAETAEEGSHEEKVKWIKPKGSNEENSLTNTTTTTTDHEDITTREYDSVQKRNKKSQVSPADPGGTKCDENTNK